MRGTQKEDTLAVVHGTRDTHTDTTRAVGDLAAAAGAACSSSPVTADKAHMAANIQTAGCKNGPIMREAVTTVVMT